VRTKARSEADDALQERDAAIERWLHEAVVPVLDRVMRGEEKLLDMTEVFSGLETRYRGGRSVV
jgi:hypothetical protein